MRYLLLVSLFALNGCGRDKNEYPTWPTNEWYAIGANANGVPCKSNLATGVETPLTADETKPCDAEIRLPVYQMEGGATVIIGNNHNLIADILSLIIIGCLYGYACNKIYKQGYRDGKDGVK